MTKNIAFCTNSMSKGGAERVISILANSFVKYMDVSIISVTNNPIEYELDNKIHFINLSKKENRINNKIINKFLLPFKTISRISNMKKVIKNNNYDLIISFLPEASFITLIANKRKCKIIVSDRNDPNTEYKNPVYKMLVKKYYPNADGFVFQTEDAKDYFRDIINFNNKHFDIIFNPVNEKFMQYNPSNNRNMVITNVGRLTEQKNQLLLIEAFSIIKEEFPNIELKIYGDGNLREKLQKTIEDYNLENRVKLMGIVDDIPKEIINSKMFVLSSDYEGMPNALIEAMTLGIPCISTDCPCGGPKMLINNYSNGILVPVGNKKEMAKAMKYIIENEKKADKISEEARKIRNIVSKEKIISQWKKIIDNVIGGNGNGDNF